jgi:tRNA G10  N-methylase Trm11
LTCTPSCDVCPFDGENDAPDGNHELELGIKREELVEDTFETAEEVLVGASGLATWIADQLDLGKVDTPVEEAMRRELRLKMRVKPKYEA